MSPGWSPVLAAAVAMIGTLAATIFTQMWSTRREDKRRAEERAERAHALGRESDLRLYQERRVAYAGYLRSLHATSEAIREIALNRDATDREREQAVANAYRENGILAAREEVTLLGTLDLALAARRAFLTVRDFRDLTAQGEPPAGDRARQNWSDHRKALTTLRAEMRKSLGIPPLADPTTLGPGL